MIKSSEVDFLFCQNLPLKTNIEKMAFLKKVDFLDSPNFFIWFYSCSGSHF